MKQKITQILSELPLRMKITFVLVMAGLIFTMCSCGSCFRLFVEYPQDNAAEELVEELIKKETDIEIDLSPLSLEKKDP